MSSTTLLLESHDSMNHGFRWLEKEEFEHLNINSVSDDSEDGYVLEVDLDYPPELHDHHNEYPLAPEKMKVTENMLSPYAKQMLFVICHLSFLGIKIYICLQPRCCLKVMTL
jgi:hypothetical protein